MRKIILFLVFSILILCIFPILVDYPYAELVTLKCMTSDGKAAVNLADYMPLAGE